MATLNQKLALNAKLHKVLHKNVYLLSLYYPMSKDLASHYKEGMLEKPNSAAFHHLSYYLMSIINPKMGSSSSWAMFEIKIEAKYRTEFLKFVNELSKDHDGHISHIMASWIVNAGGAKVTKLMFELSQVALKVHLQRRHTKVNLNIKEYNIEDVSRNVKIQERVLNKISWWRTHSINMDKIAEIYLKHIPVVELEKERQQAILKSLTSNMSKCNKSSIGKELSDIFAPSSFLQCWGEDIDRQTCVLNQKWNDKFIPLVDRSKKCKTRSEQLIQMHLQKSNKDFVLDFDDCVDILIVPSCYENELSVTQSAILRSTVQDGVLHLPNFFKSYAIIVSYCFKNYIPSHTTEYLECLLNEKKNILMLVNQKSKDLVSEVFKFHNELKDGLESHDSSCCASENASGILDILNIPSFSMQAVTSSNCSEYWQKSLDKYKFTEFKHPFKSEKIYYLADKDASLNNISKINRSVVKKGFFSSSKKPLITRKIDAKPEYLKNIEELERNMFKITDVTNKTFAPQHNMTTISRLGTDRRQSVFSQNHRKYLLTSIKKKSSVPDMTNIERDQSDRLFRKTWGNLFNESVDNSSLLQKTQSSPNLASTETNETKFRSRINRPVSERISGVKEIDYSSFLSDLGSMPNLCNASDKENVPKNHQTVITETICIENKIEIIETSKNTTPPMKVISPNRKKSVESLIDTYKKFKESRGLGTKSSDKNSGTNNSKNLADSFLEKLDLGDNKNINKRVIKKDSELTRLSTVPDLLSPSLVFQSRDSASDT